MPSFTNDDAALEGDLVRLTASAADDIITISGSFLVAPASSGVIAGRGGFDTLVLDAADLRETTLLGIERTEISDAWTFGDTDPGILDAASLSALGDLVLTGDAMAAGHGGFAITGSTNGEVFLTPRLGSNQSLVLQGSDDPDQVLRLNFSQGSYIPGDAIIYGSTFVGISQPSGVMFIGGAGSDHVIGSSGNEMFQNLGAGDVALGRGADDSFLVENSSGAILRGGEGRDIAIVREAQVDFHGGAGDDIVAFDDVRAGTVFNGGAGEDVFSMRYPGELLDVEIANFERFASNGGSIATDASTLSGLRGITFEGQVNLHLQDSAHQTIVFDWTISSYFTAISLDYNDNIDSIIGVTIDLRNLNRPRPENYNDVVVAAYEQSTILGSSGADRIGGWEEAVDATIYGFGGTDVFDIAHDRASVYGGRDGDFFNIISVADGLFRGGGRTGPFPG